MRTCDVVTSLGSEIQRIQASFCVLAWTRILTLDWLCQGCPGMELGDGGTRMRIESSVVINAPVERVFAFISDVERQPDWITAVVRVSDLSPGPLQVGSTFQLSLAFMGKTAEAGQEITRLEPNRAITQKTTSGPIATEVTMTLEPADTGTLLRNVTEADLGSLGRFAGPMITRTIKRQLDTDLQTLRDMLER